MKVNIASRQELAIKILEQLEEKTEVDYCGLYYEEVVGIIYNALKDNGC